MTERAADARRHGVELGREPPAVSLFFDEFTVLIEPRIALMDESVWIEL